MPEHLIPPPPLLVIEKMTSGEKKILLIMTDLGVRSGCIRFLLHSQSYLTSHHRAPCIHTPAGALLNL